jgi:hypothetical protein
MDGTLFKENDQWCVMTPHGNVLQVWEEIIPDGMKEYDRCRFIFHHEKGKRGVNVYAIIIEAPDIHSPSSSL